MIEQPPIGPRPRVAIVYGTRPEAIKVAPLIGRIQAGNTLEQTAVVTGQHREMVSEINRWFGIREDANLGVHRAGQSLQDLSARLLSGVFAALSAIAADAVVVHGDTSSAAIAALAAYYSRLPIIHLEAGLRSGDLLSPYPEEGNRRIIGQLASLHLAPTPRSAANLRAEGVPESAIAVTGNTVIDALYQTLERTAVFGNSHVRAIVAGQAKIVLVTAHRRESWGKGLAGVMAAIADVIASDSDAHAIVPMHPNPEVRKTIIAVLGGAERVTLCEPLSYPEFCHLIKRAHCIVTDSGGIQEEAPSVGTPVLVTRDRTERPEAIIAGAARLVGTDRDRVRGELDRLLNDARHHAAMRQVVSPYGDGCGAARAVAAIEAYFGVGARMEDFAPPAQALVHG